MKLTADLTNCPGDGLVIGADGITVDLNGHTIDAPSRRPQSVMSSGRGRGISAGAYDGLTIKDGTIQQFANGRRRRDDGWPTALSAA